MVFAPLSKIIWSSMWVSISRLCVPFHLLICLCVSSLYCFNYYISVVNFEIRMGHIFLFLGICWDMLLETGHFKRRPPTSVCTPSPCRRTSLLTILLWKCRGFLGHLGTYAFPGPVSVIFFFSTSFLYMAAFKWLSFSKSFILALLEALAVLWLTSLNIFLSQESEVS